MNIVTPIPTGIVFTNTNLNTESARRENLARETIPQTSANENSEAKAGLGSESDRLRNPGQPASPLVYERPQPNQNPTAQIFGDNSNANPDNANQESAGRESAEQRQQEQQEQAEQLEIQQLQQRDQEVRSHEQAHASVGGQYAGLPVYEYETGPDGKRYAVGGEVSIDIGEEITPDETLRKMLQVKAAALAPAEPSPQDLRVASEASQRAFEARSELNEQRAEELQQAVEQRRSGESSTPGVEPEIPDLDDIVDAIDITIPERSLDANGLGASAAVEKEQLNENPETAQLQQSEAILQRVNVIQNTYQNIATPTALNFSATA
ncbi:putative metalloprotease CJM1_0395 family protein [Alteromonas sp. ASW11-36]|uniref:Metalloprotease CJM1_0395 family protein n=1 Tax=Alteromonas arenosi TaxID=3055817 RepID=A0ABT7T0U2_9ALTE|nr:putative metalloprotease CJM1_0395 family protein [Alteromonas sp. ASW11-36]MDM7862057.1 putative metalloprotease CJM1_0395 family protein [Alteromonas sp. ASW11-36]